MLRIPEMPLPPHRTAPSWAAEYPMFAVQAEASAIINDLRQHGAVISGDTWTINDEQKYETAKSELMRGGQRQIKDMNADWFAKNGYELLDSRRLPQAEKQTLDAVDVGFFDLDSEMKTEIREGSVRSICSGRSADDQAGGHSQAGSLRHGRRCTPDRRA